MDIQQLELNQIRPYGKNPRKNDKAVKVVVDSIRQYGFQQPIVVDKNNEIIVGHTRYKAAKELGLVDGLGDLRTICRRKYGDDVRFMTIDRPMSWLQRRFGRFIPPDVNQDSGWAGDLIAAVEERVWWARFGL